MSLPNEYRPRDFDEVMGNESVIQSLEALLARDKKDIPQAFLFTGPSGCGKTTLARIVAEKLGCSGADFTEVDAAGENGIATVRNVRDNMMYAPMSGSSCRVWFFDECHMLTGAAQEGILKALEHPPKHVYFMLATTEPQKLKVTLKNRCMDFTVQSLGERSLLSLLEEIVECEKKTVPIEALKIIAQNSLGSSREAIKSLDKIIDLTPEQMSAAAERENLKQNSIIELCRALMEIKSWGTIRKIIKGLEGEDPESIRLAVLGYCASVLLNSSDAPQAFLVMDSFREPSFNNGKSAIVMAAYEALEGCHDAGTAYVASTQKKEEPYFNPDDDIPF